MPHPPALLSGLGHTFGVTSSTADVALSALVAAVLIGSAVAIGLPVHERHARVGAREQQLLLSAVARVDGVHVVGGSPTHAVVGYADTRQACAATASVRVRTDLTAGALGDQLRVARNLPELQVESTGRGVVRVGITQTLGEDIRDWSCWQ
jgi:hypothetical protein